MSSFAVAPPCRKTGFDVSIEAPGCIAMPTDRYMGAARPRSVSVLTGLTGAALALAKAVTPVAADSSSTPAPPCEEYKSFKSPNSGNEYAVTAPCYQGNKYVDRFVSHCGAIRTNTGRPDFWHRVEYWFGANTFLRRRQDFSPLDAAFEVCLKEQGGQEAHHQTKRGLIIGFSVAGGALLLLGALLLCLWAQRRRRPRAQPGAAGGVV
jgi:hypothetical protein